MHLSRSRFILLQDWFATARAGSQSRYLQMYVWDTQHELHYRTNVVPNSNINPVILQALKAMLDETNPYVTNFRYISDLPAENIGNLSMLIHADIPGLDQRTHNAPNSFSGSSNLD